MDLKQSKDLEVTEVTISQRQLLSTIVLGLNMNAIELLTTGSLGAEENARYREVVMGRLEHNMTSVIFGGATLIHFKKKCLFQTIRNTMRDQRRVMILLGGLLLNKVRFVRNSPFARIISGRCREVIMDFKDLRRDGFQNAMADKELVLEPRRLRGKSKVKIPAAMVKHSLSV